MRPITDDRGLLVVSNGVTMRNLQLPDGQPALPARERTDRDSLAGRTPTFFGAAR